MENKNKLTENELRQKIDGFSLEKKDDSNQGLKIIDEPIYRSHSLDLEEVEKNKNKAAKG